MALRMCWRKYRNRHRKSGLGSSGVRHRNFESWRRSVKENDLADSKDIGAARHVLDGVAGVVASVMVEIYIRMFEKQQRSET